MIIFFLQSEPSTWWPYVAFLAITTGISAVAGLVKALHTIRTQGWEVFRDKWLTPRRARWRKIEQIGETCNSLTEELKTISSELKTNGGSSLKDFVINIDRQLVHIEGWQKYIDETSGNATFKLGPNGSMTYASPKLCCILDADREELHFRNWVAKVISSDRQMVLRDLEDAIENKMPLDTTATFKVGNTSVRLHVTATPHVQPGGDLIGFFGRVIEEPGDRQ